MSVFHVRHRTCPDHSQFTEHGVLELEELVVAEMRRLELPLTQRLKP